MPNRKRKDNNVPSDRTALLIYCTREEAEQIRIAAKRERRTISGFVINAVMKRLAVQSQIQQRWEQSQP